MQAAYDAARKAAAREVTAKVSAALQGSAKELADMFRASVRRRDGGLLSL